MKNLLAFILILTSTSLFGQAKRLHRLPEVDTVNTIATKSDIAVTNPHGGSNDLGDVVADMRQQYGITTLKDIVDISTLKTGDSYRSAINGGVYNVTGDTTARYNINGTYYLDRATGKNSFSNIADLKKAAGKIENNSVVFVDNGAKAPVPYLITTAPPMRQNALNETKFRFVNFTEDSTTYFSIGNPDLPAENYVTYSKFIGDNTATQWNIDGDFDYQAYRADPYGGKDATRLTILTGSDNTFSKTFSSLAVDSTYTITVWFRRPEGSVNDNVTVSVQVRDAQESSAFVNISLPAGNDWFKYERTFTADVNTDRFSVQIGGDEGDGIEISHPQVQSGSINRGYVATGKTRQSFGNQVYYAYLLSDADGFIHYSWFSNIAGDDSDRVQAASVYGYSNPEVVGLFQDDDWYFGPTGQTIDILDSGFIIKGQRMGYDDELKYRTIVDFNDDTKDVFRFIPDTPNESGVGLINMSIKVISPCNRVIYQDGIFAGWWHNLTVDGVAGEDNIEVIYESASSNIYNEFYRFEFKNAKLACRTRGNSTVFYNGRFYQNDMAVWGAGTFLHVGIENCGLPAFKSSGPMEFYNLRGERLGGKYVDAGETAADKGGALPLFLCEEDASDRAANINIYNIDAISGDIDSTGARMAYLLNIEEGEFSVHGGDMHQLATPIVRSSEKTRKITFIDFQFDGLDVVQDSLDDPTIFECISCLEYDYLNRKSKGLSTSTMYRLNAKNSVLENSTALSIDNFSGRSIGSVRIDNSTIRSGASNYFTHSGDIRNSSGYWNDTDFNTTLAATTLTNGDDAALLISNGTATLADNPVLRYNSALPVGRYIFSTTVKPTATFSGSSVTVAQVATSSDFTYSQPIDSATTSEQIISFVFEVITSGDYRVDFQINGMESGDSLYVGPLSAYRVGDSFPLGVLSEKPGFVATTGTAVSDPAEVNQFYEDQVVINGNEPHDFQNGIVYDNSTSGLTATEMKEAIDEIALMVTGSTATPTTSGAGVATIAHGLGSSPSSVTANITTSGDSYYIAGLTWDATNIYVTVYDRDSGTEAASTAVNVSWIAVK